MKRTTIIQWSWKNGKFLLLLIQCTQKVPEGHCSLKWNLWHLLKWIQKRQKLSTIRMSNMSEIVCVGGKWKYANWQWCAMLIKQIIYLIILYHSIRTKLRTFSFPVSDIHFFPLSILELSRRKVMLKGVGNYTTFRYTVQCLYRVLNFSQWVHLKKSYEP